MPVLGIALRSGTCHQGIHVHHCSLLVDIPTHAFLPQEVLELVEIRLTEIAARWEDGRLSALGLAPQEVAHLVRALFEDTPARRALLTALGKAR